MKRLLKSTLSFVLMLLIVMSVLPLSAVAENGETNNVTAETESEFSGGSALDLIATNLTEGEENEEYIISSLEFEDKTAFVELSNVAECNLIVAIYDEDSMQMLASGITEVSTEHSTVTVDVDVDAMPVYFVAKAFLTDEIYAPLCTSYETFLYTTKYEEFLKATPDDYSEEVIIFDNTKEIIDFGVLNEEVVSDSAVDNMTFTYDEETLTYTFFNATDEVKSLSVGDVYYYEYGTLSNEFLLFKVKSISVSDSTVEIVQDEDISLSEAFSFIRIDAQGDYSNLEIDKSQLGEALTPIETFEITDVDFSNNGGDSPELDINSGEKSWSESFSLEYKRNDNASVTGTMSYELTTSVRLIYDAVLFGKDYYEFKSETEHKFKLVGIEVKGGVSVPKDKVKIPIPPIPVGPFTLNINIAPIVEFSDSVSFDADYIIRLVVSADNKNGMRRTENVTSEWDPELDLKIEIRLGASIELKLKLHKIVSLSLTGEGGVKFEADFSMVGVWLDKHHDCLGCIEGDINAFVEISLTLKVVIVPEIVDFSWDAIKWAKQWYLFDFYISNGLSGFSFGKGKCPNISYEVTFNVFTIENGVKKMLEGIGILASPGVCDANGDGKFTETEAFTNADGQAVFYFKPGEHSVGINYGDKLLLESFNMIESAKTIDVCIDNSYPLTGDESVGDIITFGSYPQSEVTDTELILALDEIDKTWRSYGYYSGTGDVDDGLMQPGDWMKYADVTYNGNKYRAVIFSRYRPLYTGHPSLTENTHQDENGYYINRVYYFRFEPLRWRVLDPVEGLIMCESIIDSQAYNNTIYYSSSIANSEGSTYAYFQNSSCTTYASDYAASSIRKWLNDDFYNTAFTSSEKAEIGITICDNSSSFTPKLDSATTYDRVFLLSYYEVLTDSYGFSSDAIECNLIRRGKGTDYAKCQGLLTSTTSGFLGNSFWWIRSRAAYSYTVTPVRDGGNISFSATVNNTSYGIRPALKLNPKSVTAKTYDVEVNLNGAIADSSVNLFDTSKNSCIAGNDYLLLNVSDYLPDFFLTSDNLLFVNQLTADKNGKINASFIPKSFDENSTTLLVGDFGNGKEVKEVVSENLGTAVSSLRLLNSTEYREGNNITIYADADVDRVAIYSTTFDGETVTVETENTPITVSSSKAFVLKYSDWHKAGNAMSTTLKIGETVYNVKYIFRADGDGHVYSSVVTQPTTVSEGYTTHTCSCGDSYKDNFKPAVGCTVKGSIATSGGIADEITLEFIKSGETEAAHTITLSGSDNEFSLEKIEAGEYVIRASKKNHAVREYEVTISEEVLNIDIALSLIGDINGDGKVNTLDVARVNAHARSVSVLSGYELACADVNGDGKVNTLDVARMNAHARSISSLW